jgi:hypothetical protein
MKLNKGMLISECKKAYDYYLKIFSKYIDTPRDIKVGLYNPEKYPSDAEKVPACTQVIDNAYKINFSIYALLNHFKDYVRIICWHEVAHVVCDELYRCNKVSQPAMVNGGHPILFFKVINTWKDRTPSEWEIQRLRHEIPYKKGTSEGFDYTYDPLSELKDVSGKYSYRIGRLFK